MRQLLTCGMAAVCMAACMSTPVSVKTSPSMPSPSSRASTEATISPPVTPISLSTIQRLDANVGYIASWTGSGPVLARTTDGGATWHAIRVPATRLTSLRFIDVNVGWAGGFIPRDVPQVACQQAPPSASSPCYGVVLRTADGGATWQKSLLIPYYGTYSEPVQQIQAIDGQIAWALILVCGPTTPILGPFGCPAEVRRTIDGGRTWTTMTSGYIVAIRFATQSRGWIAAANPDGTYDVKVTSDGGVTWATRLHTDSGEVVGLDAADSSNAWVMTQDGGYCSATTCTTYELFRTIDGGQSWSSVGNPKPTDTNCVGGHLVGPVFASRTDGWLAENTGAGGAKATTGLLATHDRGVTWRCLAQPSNTYLVSAADAMHLWVTSNRLGDDATTLLASDDGGTSWRPLSLAGLGGAAPVHQ